MIIKPPPQRGFDNHEPANFPIVAKLVLSTVLTYTPFATVREVVEKARDDMENFVKVVICHTGVSAQTGLMRSVEHDVETH